MLLAGCSSSPRSVTGAGAADDVPVGDIVGRPWPERVTPTGPWSASLEGSGPRMTLDMAATVVGGLRGTTLGLGRRDPDGPNDGPDAPPAQR